MDSHQSSSNAEPTQPSSPVKNAETPSPRSTFLREVAGKVAVWVASSVIMLIPFGLVIHKTLELLREVTISREVPIGSIIPFWGTSKTPPKGYEVCDGELVTTAGPLLGKRKPNLIERFLRGAPKAADELNSGGQKSVLLTIDNLPPHTHPLPFPLTQDSIEQASNYMRQYIGKAEGLDGSDEPKVKDYSTLSAGGGKAFPIEPPYQEVTWLIKVL